MLTFIFKKVCEYYKSKPEDVLKVTRKREIVIIRQVYMYFAKEINEHLTVKYSLEKIGSIVDKDHATVLHSHRTINNLIETNKQFRHEMNEINKLFESFTFDVQITDSEKKDSIINGLVCLLKNKTGKKDVSMSCSML